MMNRRTLLSTFALIGLTAKAGAANAQKAPPVNLGEARAFSTDDLIARARKMAKSDYVAPPKIPQEWIDLTYDQYRNINFHRDSALWKDSDRPFELEFFPPGLYFPTAIKVSVVDGDKAYPVAFSKEVFRMGNLVPDLPMDDTLGYAGFRIRAAINAPDRMDEFMVFQGASYFRGVARNQAYGLSGRGLALRTGDPEGEEFPEFHEFWIEGGEAGDKMIKVHALLDSPSVSGVYTFKITPGETTEMDVEASLFPRVDLDHVGLGAGTSMFLFDQTNRNKFDDFRPAVHDSDGLLIENGAGETIWRQLANPVNLQISSFVDTNPRGFGLMQRPRDLADYDDLEANYHRRPGLWVVPGEDWGQGAVTLVEIPADREIYDNIVAYWRPREAMPAGSEHKFTYRLMWCDRAPTDMALARVVNTSMGARFGGGRIVHVDFTPEDAFPDDLSEVTVHVSSNGAPVSKGGLQRNPATDGIQLAFSFDPGERSLVELRSQLLLAGKPISEVWLYRWTK